MQYDLVFEGGGAKGMTFVGALQELDARGHTHGRLLGTSAGAIAATFIAAGYSTEEMLAALCEKDEDDKPIFTSFLGKPLPFTDDALRTSATAAMLEAIDIPFLPETVENRFDQLVLRVLGHDRFRHFLSFIELGGWYSAHHFVEWLREKLDWGTFRGKPRRFSQMNFAELYEATGKHLSLIAADTSGRRMLVLNHETAPECPVVYGVRMSMSLPLVWQEVIWQKEWGLYLGTHNLTGHRIVDGGLLSNFPIELFLSSQDHVVSMMGAKEQPNVLGLLIDENLIVPGTETCPPGETTLNAAEFPLPSRVLGLINTVTQAHDKMVIEAFEQFVCRLPAAGYGTTEFDMSDERRDLLVAGGRAAMARYFDELETQPIKGDDLIALEKALHQADRIATNILQP